MKTLANRPPLPDHVRNPDCNIYYSKNFVVMDFETTTINYGNPVVPENRLIHSCWYDGLTGEYHEITGGEYDQQMLLARCEEADFLVAHNAKMELGWLRRCGLDLHKVVVFDTIIAQYVLWGNLKPTGLGLAELAPAYGLGSKDPYFEAAVKAGICPSEMPESFVSKRCYKDVTQTLGIFLVQLADLTKRDQLRTFYTHCLLTPCLTDIEAMGMHLDGELTTQFYNDATDGLRQLESDLAEITNGINLRSPKQKQQLLYETLGFKKPKDRFGKEMEGTDHDTITSLKATNKKQRDFIEKYLQYSATQALVSKNLRFFKSVVDERNCIFFGQFNQTVTRTHRLSSSGVPILFNSQKKPLSVQFQNMPRSLKRLFCSRRAGEGWLMGEADGAQLEFRIAGFLGQDEVAYDSICNGEDVHAFTASVLTKAGQETSRQDAKAHTFKPLFGGNSGTKAEVTYYQAFRQKYPGITGAQEDWKAEVLKTGALKLPTGLRFYWPDTKVTSTGYITNSTNICNYPVQYFATGEIIPIGLVCMWHSLYLLEMETFIVNTIHDSIAAEVHPEEVELFKELGQYCLTTDVYEYLYKMYGIEFNFPLGTGIKVCRNWSNTKEEFKYESTPPFKFRSTK